MRITSKVSSNQRRIIAVTPAKRAGKALGAIDSLPEMQTGMAPMWIFMKSGRRCPMFYEVMTWTLKHDTVPQLEARFEEALPHRLKYSELAAFWHTEIGPLNQVIHVWPYENFKHRADVHAHVAKDPHLSGRLAEFIVAAESEIYCLAPFSPKLGGGKKLGSIYEMRIYQHSPRSMQKVIKRWAESMPDRLAISPVAACLWCEIGVINRWVHIWPYADMEDRERVRLEAAKLKTWPPDSLEYMVRQENRILIPASFSPTA
jgi:hypothetical protein